jgi:hypothetical protein
MSHSTATSRSDGRPAVGQPPAQDFPRSHRMRTCSRASHRKVLVQRGPREIAPKLVAVDESGVITRGTRKASRSVCRRAAEFCKIVRAARKHRPPPQQSRAGGESTRIVISSPQTLVALRRDGKMDCAGGEPANQPRDYLCAATNALIFSTAARYSRSRAV